MSAVLAMTEASGAFSGPTSSIVGIVIALLFAWGCNRIAVGKGRGPILWAILGFFFTLLTLIVILIIPRKNR